MQAPGGDVEAGGSAFAHELRQGASTPQVLCAFAVEPPDAGPASEAREDEPACRICLRRVSPPVSKRLSPLAVGECQ